MVATVVTLINTRVVLVGVVVVGVGVGVLVAVVAVVAEKCYRFDFHALSGDPFIPYILTDPFTTRSIYSNVVDVSNKSNESNE